MALQIREGTGKQSHENTQRELCLLLATFTLKLQFKQLEVHRHGLSARIQCTSIQLGKRLCSYGSSQPARKLPDARQQRSRRLHRPSG